MKNNIILMLTFLLLFVAFFSSTTYTGALSLDSIRGDRYIGGPEQVYPYYQKYARGPDPFTYQSTGLEDRPSYSRLFLGASNSRITDTINQIGPDNFFVDGVGDLNEDGILNQLDCREIQLIYGTRSHYNSRRGATFNQPQTDFPAIADIDGDGQIGTYQDQHLLCIWVRDNGQAQDAFRHSLVSQTDCTLGQAEKNTEKCMDQNVVRCMVDANGVPSWTVIQPTKEEVGSRSVTRPRCVSRDGDAWYSQYAPPSLTLYNPSTA